MIPSQGRMVIVKTSESFNGSNESCAFITRAWSDSDTKNGPCAVNVTLLPDCAPPQSRTSVPLYETKEEAEAYGYLPVAWWPERR